MINKALPANPFKMHKIAVSTPVACILLVLPTGGFPEVRHWREINNYRTTCEIQIKLSISVRIYYSK